MAKATPEDIENAFELAGLLDQIGRGEWPYLGEEEPANAPKRLDEDDMEHLQHVYEIFQVMARRGGLWRVAMGLDMVLRSDLLDPNVDYISVNPVITAATELWNATQPAEGEPAT